LVKKILWSCLNNFSYIVDCYHPLTQCGDCKKL